MIIFQEGLSCVFWSEYLPTNPVQTTIIQISLHTC